MREQLHHHTPGCTVPRGVDQRGNDVTRIGICHARDAVWDALLKQDSDLFARAINYAAAYTGTNYMISVVPSFERDGSQLRLRMRVPVSSQDMLHVNIRAGGPLRAPQGDYPVGTYDVRRLILLICCSAPACLPNRSPTSTSSRLMLNDGPSDQRLTLRFV